jgi:hypothetical protein
MGGRARNKEPYVAAPNRGKLWKYKLLRQETEICLDILGEAHFFYFSGIWFLVKS